MKGTELVRVINHVRHYPVCRF